MSAYKVSLREMRFFLWELLDTEQRFLSRAPFRGRDRAYYDALLEQARDYALRLGESYRAGDVEGCSLEAADRVRIPSDFHALWHRYREEWVPVFHEARAGGGSVEMPPLITQVILEMFMGANPAFMTYGGFTRPAIRLLEQHGTPSQKRLLPRLEQWEWDACFCATEAQAGSDLTAATTAARALGDGTYAVSGEKIYISAGMHDLTANTLYFVLAREQTARPDSFSLSCLVVPRFWPDEATGELRPNHIECLDLPRKMGLKGCANTHLRFGHAGTTRGWLLGDRKNVGLLQLVPLMQQARMSTGMFGVGVASSAYLHAVAHARQRLQGRPIDRAADVAAARVPIIEHADVQRMLLDMKARVEGCRGLLGKLAAAATHATAIQHSPGHDPAAAERWRKLQQLLTPICKAFISDQSWRICETAIQVHGGLGYTDASPVEQNARDVKILSIWEGTNYIQAQDLVRDKLGFGRNSVLMRESRAELEASLERHARHAEPGAAPWFAALRAAADTLGRALDRIAHAVQHGQMHMSSQFYSRFLEIFGVVGCGWVLLESACIAQRRLREPTVQADAAETAFYGGKVKTCAYFFANVLPLARASAALFDNLPGAACSVHPDELSQAC